MHSPWTSTWSLAAALTMDAPCSLLVIWTMDIDTNPCHCIAMDSAMASAAAQAGTSPWPQEVGLITHNRLLLSTLESPVPSLLTVLKLLCFSFSHLTTTYSHSVVAPNAGWLRDWGALG